MSAESSQPVLELFLVAGEVSKSYYMDEDDSRRASTRETRLVRAESSAAAQAKFAQHFEDKSSDYAVSYRVFDIEVYETLV